jgi:hypothetical protein
MHEHVENMNGSMVEKWVDRVSKSNWNLEDESTFLKRCHFSLFPENKNGKQKIWSTVIINELPYSKQVLILQAKLFQNTPLTTLLLSHPIFLNLKI